MITGRIDQRRPLLSLPLHRSLSSEQVSIEVWFDTGFDGHFVLPEDDVIRLGLEKLGVGEARLADGSEIELISYLAYLNWFDEWTPLQVIASDAGSALFGTALLDDCEVRMDFGCGLFTIDKAARKGFV